MGDQDLTSEAEAFSPASSVASSASAMSISPVPSPCSTASSEVSSSTTTSLENLSSDRIRNNGTAKGKRSWEQQEEDPSNTKRLRTTTPMPKATHKPEYNEQLQNQFASAVDRCDASELDRLLRNHSEKIDIDKYLGGEGETALQRFCRQGSLPLARLMVRFGANASVRTREGWTTTHIAAFSGNPELMSYILRCGKR